jgi:hypothetical protein
MHIKRIKTLILVLIVVSHHDFNKEINVSEAESIKERVESNKKRIKINLEEKLQLRKQFAIYGSNLQFMEAILQFMEATRCKITEEEEGNEIRVLNDETRNQTQEIRVVAITEAEQDKSRSDTIREEESAMDERRKVPQWRKTITIFISL